MVSYRMYLECSRARDEMMPLLRGRRHISEIKERARRFYYHHTEKKSFFKVCPHQAAPRAPPTFKKTLTMTMSKRQRRSLDDYDMDANIVPDYVSEAHADRSYNDINATDFQLEQSDDSCSMPCHNGGTCQPGRPIHGFAAELLEDEDTLHFGTFNPSEHCVCPSGWTGLHCEVKLVKCPLHRSLFQWKQVYSCRR